MVQNILSDVTWSIEDAEEDLKGLTVRKDQVITDDFLASLADERLASKDRSKNFHKVASIPMAVVEHWQRQGFNIYEQDARAILKKLRDEDLTAFIATTKRV